MGLKQTGTKGLYYNTKKIVPKKIVPSSYKGGGGEGVYYAVGTTFSFILLADLVLTTSIPQHLSSRHSFTMPLPTHDAAVYVFSHVWSLFYLETYICEHGTGISRPFLQASLGYRTRGAVDYVQALVDTACALLFAGHQLQPGQAMAEAGYVRRRPDHPVVDAARRYWTEEELFIQQEAENAWAAEDRANRPAAVVPNQQAAVVERFGPETVRVQLVTLADLGMTVEDLPPPSALVPAERNDGDSSDEARPGPSKRPHFVPQSIHGFTESEDSD